MRLLLLASLASLTAFGAGSAAYAQEAEFDYKDPSSWGKGEYSALACTLGKNQSPIDLKGAINAELAELKPDYKAAKIAAIKHTGHTVQVGYADGKTLSGYALTIDGRPFDLKQIHFHTPSENKINGEGFAMEAHFVHKNGPDLAVLAVMLKDGKENAAIKALWEHMPAEKGMENAMPFNPGDLLPENLSYFRFNGSLTTPPCDEGVRWLVVKTPITVSKEQVEKFEHAVHGKNARPIQAVNARPILSGK